MAVVSPFAQIQDSLPPLTPAPPPIDLSGQIADYQDAPTNQVAATPSKTTAFAPMEGEKQHISDRLARDYAKDEAQPTGLWGKFWHGLNHATGGDTRRGWEEMGLQKSLNDLLGEQARNEQEEAVTGKTNEETREMPGKTASEEGLQGAQTRHLNAETDSAGQPSFQHIETDQGIFAFNPKTNELVPLTYQGKPLQPFAKPSADNGAKTIQIEQNGKPHQMGWDAATQRYDIDEGESGEKPPTVRVETPHEQFGEKQGLLKLYQPGLDSAERFNVMSKNYEDAIKSHDQQAMLSLLANHLGMTMGLQKGARMTKDIVQEAQQSRPWLQGMQAKFDKDGYLSGVTLSPEQMRQMVDLGRERFAEDMTKANNEAGYMGAAGEGPARTPNKSTINHYMALAGGDVNKAKELAARDGWTVGK
jgi:hypothetical protein